jgi:hypothetical protein
MPQFIAPRPINLQLRKPRNPHVAPALLRQAGRHAGANPRQAARRDLHKQILLLGQGAQRSP